MRVKRASRLGYCAGVRAADLRVKHFASTGARAAILGQVVHNERVVAEMESLGVRTVQSLEEIEEPVVVFSAHGVPPSTHLAARGRGLEVLDTTCRFVYDIHRESAAAATEGAHLVFVGDPRHREVVGYTHDLDPGTYHVIQTLEQASSVDWRSYPEIRVFYQTTLCSEDYEEVVAVIERANPRTTRADTICYATRQNQEAARVLAADPEIEAVIVIGGTRSANTRHLLEICSRTKPSYLVQGVRDINQLWINGLTCVGLTAGASTPDSVIDEVEAWLTARP
jgi:4-hydroxy-3-methylbut-2-enyl diphosphate reductase